MTEVELLTTITEQLDAIVLIGNALVYILELGLGGLSAIAIITGIKL